MKKLFEFIKKSPYFLICILALILLLPAGLSSPPESDKRAIATMLGFDLIENNQIEATMVMLSPIENANFEQNDTVVTAKGETIASALNNLSLHVGKPVGLAHNEAIIIGQNLAESNLSDRLDTIARNKDISNNIPIIVCKGLAKEIVMKSRDLSETTGLSITELLFYSDKFIMSTNTTLESFYKGLFSPSRSVIVNALEINKVEEQSGQSTTNESSSQDGQNKSSSSSTSNELDKIRNQGESCLVKDGSVVAYLSNKETRGVCWIDHTATFGAIEVDNVNSQLLNDAKIHVSIRDKIVNKHTYFENGTPVVKFIVKLAVQIKEIYQKGADKDILNNNIHYLTEEVKDAIGNSIKDDFSSALSVLKEHDADAIGVYDLLYRNNKKEFKEFLQTLDEEDDYFDKVSFRFIVECIEYK